MLFLRFHVSSVPPYFHYAAAVVFQLNAPATRGALSKTRRSEVVKRWQTSSAARRHQYTSGETHSAHQNHEKTIQKWWTTQEVFQIWSCSISFPLTKLDATLTPQVCSRCLFCFFSVTSFVKSGPVLFLTLYFSNFLCESLSFFLSDC